MERRVERLGGRLLPVRDEPEDGALGSDHLRRDPRNRGELGREVDRGEDALRHLVDRRALLEALLEAGGELRLLDGEPGVLAEGDEKLHLLVADPAAREVMIRKDDAEGAAAGADRRQDEAPGLDRGEELRRDAPVGPSILDDDRLAGRDNLGEDGVIGRKRQREPERRLIECGGAGARKRRARGEVAEVVLCGHRPPDGGGLLTRRRTKPRAPAKSLAILIDEEEERAIEAEGAAGGDRRQHDAQDGLELERRVEDPEHLKEERVLPIPLPKEKDLLIQPLEGELDRGIHGPDPRLVAHGLRPARVPVPVRLPANGMAATPMPQRSFAVLPMARMSVGRAQTARQTSIAIDSRGVDWRRRRSDRRPESCRLHDARRPFPG